MKRDRSGDPVTQAEREAAARRIRCPKCNAQPHFSCRRLTARRVISLKRPHRERLDAVAQTTKED
jgi:hypothetical protein